MPSALTKRRSTSDDFLIGSLLVMSLAVAFVFAFGSAGTWDLKGRSSSYLAVPDSPLPIFIQSSSHQGIVRVILDSDSATERSLLSVAISRQLDAGCYPDGQSGTALRDFFPLHRRPPPISS
jgi:hypothetical protein